MSLSVRICPRCGDRRAATELLCENTFDGALCHWMLSDVEITTRDQVDVSGPIPAASETSATTLCENGHALGPGELICLACGGVAIPHLEHSKPPIGDDEGSPRAPEEAFRSVGRWRVIQPVEEPRQGPYQAFQAEADGRVALLTLYEPGHEPDPAVYERLRTTALDHVPEHIEMGRSEGRVFIVTEHVQGGSLQTRPFVGASEAGLVSIIVELEKALTAFAETGLRHRDLRPNNILVRSEEPLDLVVTGFGSARLSDFDLEAAAPLLLSRYSAPETIFGAVSAASDWWSLGVILLEQATSGHCFAGVDDQAFQLHVVTRGLDVPQGLETRVRTILRGLLARDPLVRWSGEDVRAWLRGEERPLPQETGAWTEAGAAIELNGVSYRDPAAFALAACSAANWAAARQLTLSGAVATWLSQRDADPQLIAECRRVGSDSAAQEDHRHALAMMSLNPALPLVVRGDLVTPAWLLAHPDESHEILRTVTPHLERMNREPSLLRLKQRSESVREKAMLLAIQLDESRLKAALLAASRVNLEAEWDVIRRHFPDTDHAGLGSLMAKGRLSEEDLILLVSAEITQFTALETLIEVARATAAGAGVAFDRDEAARILVQPRREIFAAIDERTAGLARCGIVKVDGWADAFRVERRLGLARAVTLLAVPAEIWQEPPRAKYFADLISIFERRVSATVGHGPLARFALGKTTPRLDVFELATSLRPAASILSHIISRTAAVADLDPHAWTSDASRYGRLRRFVAHADLFQRDTGINGRYVGFPFLVHAARGLRPRLVPILLWPVVVRPNGPALTGAAIGFDDERYGVRLNPALETLLGTDEFRRFAQAREEVLSRSTLLPEDVLDVYATLAGRLTPRLSPLPPRDSLPEGPVTLISPSAALFNAEFTGQSISEDLRALAQLSPEGSALEVAVRMSPAGTGGSDVPVISDLDRFPTAAGDPSQDAAVLRSRQAPGLVVEGPPGTGKSQTIVNVITDAIGRGETVLVVCQKQAALTVVQKRLAAEGLGDRICAVVDGVSDRASILTSLSEQTKESDGGADLARHLRKQRQDKAAGIEKIEAELDRSHAALHAHREEGESYRDVIGELIALEAEGTICDAPRLRRVLNGLNRHQVARVAENCAPVAPLWLQSDFEESPLKVLKQFPVDAHVEEDVQKHFDIFLAAEALRASKPRGPFEVASANGLDDWLTAAMPLLKSLTETERQWLAKLFTHFANGGPGMWIIEQLRACSNALEQLDPHDHSPAISRQLAHLADTTLRARCEDAALISQPVMGLRRLSFARIRAKRRTRHFLDELAIANSDGIVETLLRALRLEIALRPLRAALQVASAELPVETLAGHASLQILKEAASERLSLMCKTAAAADFVLSCPLADEAAAVAIAATPQGFNVLNTQIVDALGRLEARDRSERALAHLSEWFEADWIDRLRVCIASNEATGDITSPIGSRLPQLMPFQKFRARATLLETIDFDVFAVLRGYAGELRAIPAADLSASVGRLIRREWLRALKMDAEERCPELLLSRDDVEVRVRRLAQLDADMRDLNRRLLAVEGRHAGRPEQWQSLTKLRGPQAKGLRAVFNDGMDLGLLRLRPVWLMSPDVASRILPLTKGLFDLVIFDEASQMPVEYAVPVLFRGRRVLVAGDEKQMPPTNFFGSQIEEDLGADDNVSVEDMSDAERDHAEERWNRRDIQSCPDLLQLARGFLPVVTLQIHYRSKYRELISYSNAAFYRSALSVPARHPDQEIATRKPIEVVRVNGVYEAQTNEREAEQVVAELARIWSRSRDERPSIGVVTFNRKQADLVEDKLSLRALEDEAFAEALEEERGRRQGGEDMGFFVRNLENVQGDERDYIIFSTTFGYDPRGSFRRLFGALGQVGGERRLNVAVTRAREKVLLVTSIPVAKVSDWLGASRMPEKPRDYLQAYLDYAEKVSRGDLRLAREQCRRLSPAPTRASHPRNDIPDGFLSSVQSFLEAAGYRPVTSPDHDDAFGLDLAIVDPRTGLFGFGIECDAPRHPLLERARGREVWRRQVLSRAIPRLHRISSRAWYEEGQEERARLLKALEDAMATKEAA